MSEVFLTPRGLLSYPHLFKAVPKSEGSEKLVFTTSVLFDEETQRTSKFRAFKSAIEQMIEDYAKEKKIKSSIIRSPFLDGNEKSNSAYEDKIYISPWSNFQPAVIDEDKQPVLSDSDIYPGMLARVSVRPFTWTFSGKHGISFGLNAVQIYTNVEMPRLDGRVSADKLFDDDDDEF